MGQWTDLIVIESDGAGAIFAGGGCRLAAGGVGGHAVGRHIWI